MIIKKIHDDLEILLDNKRIIFDPTKIKDNLDCITILSDIQKNLNTNKFFNLPGEYEVQGVYFKGYLSNKSLIYVFNYKGINFIYLTDNINDGLLNQILDEWGEIDIALIKSKLPDLLKIKNKLKLKILIDVDNKNNIKGEKVKEAKINVKKIEEKDYILV